MSIIVGIASFIVSMILHLFINYLVNKFGKRYAKLMRSEKGIIPRPVTIDTDDEYQILNMHPECRMLKENALINQTQLMSAFSYSGTLQQTSAPPTDMEFFFNSWRTILSKSKCISEKEAQRKQLLTTSLILTKIIHKVIKQEHENVITATMLFSKYLKIGTIKNYNLVSFHIWLNADNGCC